MTNSTPNFDPTHLDSVHAWRRRYERLGLRTIPLIGKAPATHLSWRESAASALWQSVGPDFAGNIGILLGNGLVVADADDQSAITSLSSGFRSMGLRTLVVKTPHGMHFYLKVSDIPAAYSHSLLPSGVGEGELRARNCYVVAPASQADGVLYRWLDGTPERLATQRVVHWAELAWLLPNAESHPMVKAVPIRLLHREMPPKAKSLLEALAIASKGEAIGAYATRSEAEAAVVSILILAGWSQDEIQSTFDLWKPGKYWETKARDRQTYVDRTFTRALSSIASHPTRVAVAHCWQAVSANPRWKGADGFTRRDTLLGLLALCWQFASWEIFAPQRSLAEYAATSSPCISRTLPSLCSDGFVERLNSVRTVGKADRWRVNPLSFVSSEVMICGKSPRIEEWDVGELWSRQGLGQTAGTICDLLSPTPVRVSPLHRQTEKAWSTVNVALHKLEQCGLSNEVPEGWIRGPRTVREVADEFGTKLRASRRQARHTGERERFAERLEQLAQGENARRPST
jgi:hypothetical protein